MYFESILICVIDFFKKILRFGQSSGLLVDLSGLESRLIIFFLQVPDPDTSSPGIGALGQKELRPTLV